MKKNRETVSLIIILVAAISIKFIFFPKKKIAEVAPVKVTETSKLENAQATVSKVASNSVTVSGNEKRQADNLDMKKITGPVSKSMGCAKNPVAKEITLTENEVFQIYRNQKSYSKSILLDPFRFCIQAGDLIEIRDFKARGKIRIEGLELVQINPQTMAPASKTKIVNLLTLKSWNQLTQDFFQMYDFNPLNSANRLGLLVVYTLLDKKDFNWDVAGTRRPPLEVGFNYLKKDSLLKGSKVLLIDVRSENEFKKGSISGAVNFPFLFKPRNPNEMPTPLNVQKSSWVYRGLPQDKKSAVVVFGNDLYDPRGWAAAIALNMLKFRNIGFVLEGYLDLDSQPPQVMPVAKYPIAKNKILNAKKLLEMNSQSPQIIYVGTQETRSQQFSSFLRAPYYEASSTLYPSEKAGEQLRKSGDLFNYESLNLSHDQPIVLTDFNDASNRPLKAALWLESVGFTNVFIFPGGLSNLLSLSEAIPETVNCIILSNIKQCKQ